MKHRSKYDIIVIGAGHAGIEAAYISSMMGQKVALLTMDLRNIGRPSCNPSIGGTAKGHLVKEIDSLGGVMGLLADKAGLLFKMLNTSKGPAVWSPRTQIDKDLYPMYAYDFLKRQDNITFIKGSADEIIVSGSRVEAIRTKDNEIIKASKIILCAGTFLNGKMFTGEKITYGGRFGEPSADKISDLLSSNGLKKGRLKTGTPPRIFADSIDYSKVSFSDGDEHPIPFSHKTRKVKNLIMCYATETSLATHEILRTGFSRSPMFTGKIEGTGPRYCPSIEDKIDRFSERDSHKILLEPEGLNTQSVYVNGFSTSLPEDVQEKGLRTIKGLERCVIKRYGYAIEYDFFYPYQLKFTLETKAIDGLYFAGQINGTSGYEEAAAQGLIAGINATLNNRGEGDFSLKRNEAYIGVLIDDLINKNSDEPYRIFTSLAEYRLLLRQDNAKYRLMKYGSQFGTVSRETYEKVRCEEEMLQNAFSQLKEDRYKADKVNDYLIAKGENIIKEPQSLFLLAKRENCDIAELIGLDADIQRKYSDVLKDKSIAEQLRILIKYDGYIERQMKEVEYFLENETKYIPTNFDYNKLNSISNEAREKLIRIRPASLGQASRIAGVSATDISVLSLYLK